MGNLTGQEMRNDEPEVDTSNDKNYEERVWKRLSFTREFRPSYVLIS